jgi:hypothetical protein
MEDRETRVEVQDKVESRCTQQHIGLFTRLKRAVAAQSQRHIERTDLVENLAA